jgi:hypothetical protein
MKNKKAENERGKTVLEGREDLFKAEIVKEAHVAGVASVLQRQINTLGDG